MFKNEAGNLAKTLESVKPHIDGWTFVDTGSVDKTSDVILDTMAHCRGRLHFEDFVDFAATRNRVLELDKARVYDDPDTVAIFSLMMSGDEVLEGGAELRAFLEENRDSEDGAFAIAIQAGDRTWTYPRIIRTGAGWRYVGEVHEVPVGPDGTTTARLAPGKIVHTVSDPEKRAKRIREFDYPTLTRLVNDESYSLAERCQWMFFLADTNTAIAADMLDKADGDLSKLEPGSPYLSHQMAAMALYFRCAQLMEASESQAHDFQKAMFSYFFYFHVADKIGIYTSEEMIPRLSAIVEAAPGFPEARFLLAKHSAIADYRQGLFHALEAADVAHRARANPTNLPTDARIEWMSLRIAAECARAAKDEKYMRELAQRALTAGAPAPAFAGML